MTYISSPRIINSSRNPNHPYSPTIASSASSSSSSIFSLVPSISSAASSVISLSSFHSSEQGHTDAWGQDNRRKDGTRHAHPVPVRVQPTVPIEQRQHPRRTARPVESSIPACTANEVCAMPPVPPLVRQTERKVNFVDNLVDSAAQIVETIWPTYMKSESSGGKGVLPLRTFIQETLRRSRTSYSTLQVALYYLIVVRPYIPKSIPSDLPSDVAQRMRALQCGRRMFLAALILASKYLQDRNYSARAWSRISGLQTTEININEMAFLEAVCWRLHISEANFQRWTDLVVKYTSSTGSVEVDEVRKAEWCRLILKLTPDLREEGTQEYEGSRKGPSSLEHGAVDMNSIPSISIDSSDARFTPRPSQVMSTASLQKVTVSSMLSSSSTPIRPLSTLEPQPQTPNYTQLSQSIRLTSLTSSSPLKTPAVRFGVGNAMACAAATAQIGQLQRCTTEDINMLSRRGPYTNGLPLAQRIASPSSIRSTLQRRSSLSTSMSSSPETYSDSSTNSSPSRFAFSRSSSISSASSVESILPPTLAAQSVAGKKFSRIPLTFNETIPEASSTETLVASNVSKSESGLNTPTPSPPKYLALRPRSSRECFGLKSNPCSSVSSSPHHCSRKRQRVCDLSTEIEMETDDSNNSSGVTPHLKAQLRMRTPPTEVGPMSSASSERGIGIKRLRCGTQEPSTMILSSVNGYRGNNEVL